MWHLPLKLGVFLSFFCFYISAQSDSIVNFELRFKLDSYALSATEKTRLDSLLAAFPLEIQKEVGIFGHTDSLADIDYNRALSKKRVSSVLQFLVFRGLDPIKVNTDFYGEEKPGYENSPDQRFKNRRVELQIKVDMSLLPDPERDITQEVLKTGDKLRLSNLNFVGNQPIPEWESVKELKGLLLVMLTNPDLEIALQGHVCCSNDYQLSLARARMVYDFLMANGVAKSRLEFEGYGNTQALFKEIDEKSRALNRRVEVEVLYNSDLRVEAKLPRNVKVEAPILNISFVANSARFTPSGDFMLGLVAAMLKESEGYRFEITVYDNINNKGLSAQRASAILRLLRKKGVPAKRFKSNSKSQTAQQLTSNEYNLVNISILSL